MRIYIRLLSGAVLHFGFAFHFGAVGATEERAVGFHAMPNDSDATVGAGGRERVDSALEGIEDVGFTAHSHLKRFIVVIATGFASRHAELLKNSPYCHDKAGIIRIPHNRRTVSKRNKRPRDNPWVADAVSRTASQSPLQWAVQNSTRHAGLRRQAFKRLATKNLEVR
jgi:hypothetical protein